MKKPIKSIKQILITLPVLYMLTANDAFRLENDASKLAAVRPLFQFQESQWVPISNHSKKLPQALQNYEIIKLELTCFAYQYKYF